ncbi:MAG: hypothetical protein ACJAUH_001461, partial [Saprospiraceae bacterium]
YNQGKELEKLAISGGNWLRLKLDNVNYSKPFKLLMHTSGNNTDIICIFNRNQIYRF